MQNQHQSPLNNQNLKSSPPQLIKAGGGKAKKSIQLLKTTPKNNIGKPRYYADGLRISPSRFNDIWRLAVRFECLQTVSDKNYTRCYEIAILTA